MSESYGESIPSLVSLCPHMQSVPLSADYLFKFLIIGSAGSGKSCLLHHFIESKCEYIHYAQVSINNWLLPAFSTERPSQ